MFLPRILTAIPIRSHYYTTFSGCRRKVGNAKTKTTKHHGLRARAREIVLVDRDLPRAKAVATDMHYCVPLSPLVDVRDGDYDDLGGAGLVVLTVGVNEKADGLGLLCGHRWSAVWRPSRTRSGTIWARAEGCIERSRGPHDTRSR